MARAGMRNGWGPVRTGRDETARRAVILGAVLTVAVVLVATLTALLGPHRGGPGRSAAVSGFISTLMSKHGSDDSDDDSDSGSDDSDSGDSGAPDDSGGHHGKKKHDGDSDSDGSGSDSDSGDSDDSGGSGGGDSGGSDSGGSGGGSSGDGSGSDGASSGAGPTGMALPGAAGLSPNTAGAGTGVTGLGANGGPSIAGPSGTSNGGGTGLVPSGPTVPSGGTASLPVPSDGGGVTTTKVLCSSTVDSQAELTRALQSAGPDDVICFQQSAAGSPGDGSSGPPSAGQGGVGSSSGPQPSTVAPGPQPSTVLPGLQPSTGTASGLRSGGAGSGGVVADPATLSVESGGPPGASTPAQTGCTKRSADASSLTQALGAAAPGDRICVTGNITGQRLKIAKGGTAQAPVSVIGNGRTTVKGISVDGSNVVVDGFQVLGAAAPGIELHGSNITVRNNTVSHPTGGDFDGLRFFGSNLRILHNTIMNISPDGSGAHADCMQTFATDSDSGASQHVLIDGNKCQKIDNQCLIAEGPNSSAGDGSGQGKSSDFTFSNNICDVGASQATEIDDVQGVRMLHNMVTGKPDKAFSFQNKSTGAVVQANKIASAIGYEVGMDSTSKVGYQGPKVGGAP